MATVCRIWGVSRATLYRHRAIANAANDARPPGRRGPQGAGSDTELLESDPGGDRSLALHRRGLSQDLGAAAGARRAHRGAAGAADHEGQRPSCSAAPDTAARHPHDGTIVTEKVDQVWGTDMTQTVTTGEGRAYVFIAVDHCSGEFVGTHAASGASRWEALEPIRRA
jgi:putative transposase